MKESKLLKEMFKFELWQEMLDRATDKGVDLKIIKELCYPENRAKLYKIISEDKYNVFPPRISRIPKDNGDFREVYINEPRDRVILSIINDCLFKLFPHYIHKNCVSYQKGKGTQEIVKNFSNEIVRLGIKNEHVGYKSDFSKFFDNLSIEVIDNLFDRIEKELGFAKNSEPVINILRRYYHQDLYFDVNGNLCERFQSLKQGCAISAWLSCAALYELDEFMSNKYSCYVRYSDDVVCVYENTSEIINDMSRIIKPYGIKLNPKKVEPIYIDKWVKFLGFNIKGDMITLSRNRVKKFQKEIEKRSIKRKNCTSNQARRAIIKYLYEGKFCWASSCLGTINVEPDIQELNKFIMDCIRACETGKKKIGGLGSVNNLQDRTILRGKGKNVKANRSKTGYIENYLSVKCLSNNIKMNVTIFEATVRNMKG